MTLKKIMLMVALSDVLLSSCGLGPLDPRIPDDPDNPWDIHYFTLNKL